MKAIQAQSLSGPEGLVYTDVETPGAGPNVVVVDVKAAGVCFPDYLMTKGEYQLKMEPPFVPGIETAGVVRSAPEGSGIKPGDRVMAFNFIGGYAERVAVAPSNILPTPPQLDDAEAVALIANYHTMYFAYARRGQLRAGETVLVLGAAGGIGTAAIQIAKGMGAKVIAVVNRTAATEFVKSVGADIVLPWKRAGPRQCVRRPAVPVSTWWSTRSADLLSTTLCGHWPQKAGCWSLDSPPGDTYDQGESSAAA